MIRENNVPVAVDVIVWRKDYEACGCCDYVSVLLVKRKNPPEGWALPGGFLEAGESIEAGARRELAEETGLEIRQYEQFRAYGNPGRDPRGPVVSIVGVGQVLDYDKVPVGADDAAEAQWFPLTDLPLLAFDHKRILEDWEPHASEI